MEEIVECPKCGSKRVIELPKEPRGVPFLLACVFSVIPPLWILIPFCIIIGFITWGKPQKFYIMKCKDCEKRWQGRECL